MSREIIHGSRPGVLKTVQHNEYCCHSRIVSFGKIHVGCTVLTNHEYPTRVAYSLLTKALDKFTALHAPEELSRIQKDTSLQVPALVQLISQYQTPEEADEILKVQKNLDETREVLFETIDALIERQGKLEDLIDRSEDLSFKSKVFMKDAEKLNSCCVLF